MQNKKMKINIFQTQDEMAVIKMEATLINEMIEKGHLHGELAEVGVYEGGSAEIIRKAIPSKPLHLFDTFTGLPNTIKKGLDADSYYEGHMQVDFEKVKYYFRQFNDVHIYPGFFPDTAESIKDRKFSFVHIDTDIYQSTRDALIFFWPRLEVGGSILMHDYPAHAGVKKAVDELMDGVGTKHLGKWKAFQCDPMIESGNRQLIIRKRFDHPLNLYIPPPPPNPQVYLSEEEEKNIINGKS